MARIFWVTLSILDLIGLPELSVIKQGTSVDDFPKFYYKTFAKSYPGLLSAANVVQLIISIIDLTKSFSP